MFRVLTLSALLFLATLFASPSFAFNTCSYSSTQVRVQPNVQTPWTHQLAVGCGDSVNVGAFHNGSGQFATDTQISIYGPSGFFQQAGNGQSVKLPNAGNYRIQATTKNQTGAACSDVATVQASCFSSGPIQGIIDERPNPPATCSYSSTQARVQKSINDPWTQNLELGCNAQFRVGSFHNGSGQFATDTAITMTAPSGAVSTLSNATSIAATQNGTYTIKVATNNQSGPACTETATVKINCQPPSPTPPPTGGPACQYSSTQARVQTDINSPWQESLTLGCFNQFNVGSFHNGSGQFATDTKLSVTGQVRLPLIGSFRLTREFKNSDTVRPIFPGTYTLNVTTNNQSTQACQAAAQVQVNCNFFDEYLSGWRLI